MNKENKAWEVSCLRKIMWLGLCFAGGTLYAASLPPFNWSFAIYISLLPVLYCGCCFKWKFSLLCGWIWGLGWSLFCYQFLREIEPFVPYMLAPVISIWPALWAALLPALKKYTIFPAKSQLWNVKEKKEYLDKDLPWYRICLFIFSAAILFTLIEWTRSRLFVWNDFSVTQWRNTIIIQIAAITGSYGIGFFIALVNCSFFSALFFRRNRIVILLPAVITAAIIFTFGAYNIKKINSLPKPDKVLRAALVQCDLSQRRRATEKQVYEAIEVCTDLSKKCAELKPQLIIWPESAVPIPLNSAGMGGEIFRRKFADLMQNSKIPILAGMLAFKLNREDAKFSVTNSAMLFDADCRMKGRYDKIHRVPYGEYVPFRKYLPEAIIKAVDMGRDLEPGNNFEPITIAPGIKSSIAVCYEGVFGYLMRKFALRGSNLFIVISNDAWYPESSEPEQHLANAVIRCVETGLFMIRCGNNGGSGVVTPDGRFTQYIGSKAERPELLRERAYGVVEVPIYSNLTRRTIFVEYGEWFILILGVFAMTVTGFCITGEFKRREYSKRLKENRAVPDMGR